MATGSKFLNLFTSRLVLEGAKIGARPPKFSCRWRGSKFPMWKKTMFQSFSLCNLGMTLLEWSYLIKHGHRTFEQMKSKWNLKGKNNSQVYNINGVQSLQ